MEEITIEFQWDRAEYLRAIRKANFFRPFRSLLTSAFLVLVGGSMLVAIGNSYGTYLLGLGALYVALAFWLRHSGPSRIWKKGIGIQEPIRMTFDEDGISTKLSDSESRVTWRHFPYSTEWSDYYFLRRSRRSAAKIVPKHGIKSPRDEAVFRSLLDSHTQATLLPSVELDGF
jgi:YcxB-like protein